MSLLDHQDWPAVKPYIHMRPATDTARSRNRIELRDDAPDDVKQLALAMTMECVRCGAPMHPFRRRKGRSGGTWQRIYFAATCPLHINVGCARSAAATTEYRAIEEACA